MGLRLSYCRYRLLFKHPFGTAHGLRDGTDSVFIRAEEDGVSGSGEATLPPYLSEDPDSVLQRLSAFDRSGPWTVRSAMERLSASPDLFAGAPAARAALHTALLDLGLKLHYYSNDQWNTYRDLKQCITLMTVGSGALADVPAKLADTREAAAVKVKLGGADDRVVLEAVKALDDRMLFLDANQGLRSVAEALQRIEWAGAERVIGIEQPFAKDRTDLHQALKDATAVPVYGDESLQDLAELKARAVAFDGVNVKLMKCGGLDRAAAMISRARGAGLKVMLGSMSESSLGCTAMAALAGQADVVDLDGPWLLRNDPFQGITMGAGGRLERPQGPGLGHVPIASLPWIPFGA